MVIAEANKVGRIYPNLKLIRECSVLITLTIAKHCYAVCIFFYRILWLFNYSADI